MRNCFLRLKCLMMIMSIIGLTLCLTLGILFLPFGNRVYTYEDGNSFQLYVFQSALPRYQSYNQCVLPMSFFSQESTSDEPGLRWSNIGDADLTRIDIQHPAGCDAKELSWRIQLLPYCAMLPDISQILSQVFKHENAKGNTSRQHLLETPPRFHVFGWDYEASLFLMLPPSTPDSTPVIVGVKTALFNWYENGDIELWNLLNDATDDTKLYEVRSDKIVLCDKGDSSVPLLAADGNVYFIPVTTTVGIFKKIVDSEKIKTLRLKKHRLNGVLTSFYE